MADFVAVHLLVVVVDSWLILWRFICWWLLLISAGCLLVRFGCCWLVAGYCQHIVAGGCCYFAGFCFCVLAVGGWLLAGGWILPAYATCTILAWL